MYEVVAHQRAIRRRDWYSRRVDFGADAASFEDVTQVLHESVADVDRGGHRPERREPVPRIQPRMRANTSLDQIFSCRAILSRITSALQLARQDTPAERCITERAGHEYFVARAR